MEWNERRVLGEARVRGAREGASPRGSRPVLGGGRVNYVTQPGWVQDKIQRLPSRGARFSPSEANGIWALPPQATSRASFELLSYMQRSPLAFQSPLWRWFGVKIVHY